MINVDVLIIGAGLSGSACALNLARAGWRVLLIDKEHFPRHKTCGGFLGPENRDWLVDIGVWTKLVQAGACRLERSVLTASMGASVSLDLDGEALGVSRSILDQEMLNLVRSSGVTVLEGARIKQQGSLVINPDILIDHYGQGSEVIVRARHIVMANGHPPVPIGSKYVQLGIDALYENIQQQAGSVMLHCCRHGHVGINPFENGQVNVCYVVDLAHFEKSGRNPERILGQWMMENPHLAKALDGARRVTRWKAAKIPVRRNVLLRHNMCWFTGDAAAFTDTCTGGGMSIALAGGRSLAEALIKGHDDRERLTLYRQAYRRDFTVRRRMAGLFGWCAHQPFLVNLLIGLLARNQQLAQLAMTTAHPAHFPIPNESPA